MNFEGAYVVKSDGVILGEYKNMITTNGLNFINQFLSGQSLYWADSIAVGALQGTPTTIDTEQLEHELYRYPVNFKSYEVVTASGFNRLILKATIDPASEFQAYELGLFPAPTDPDDFVENTQITTFSESVDSAMTTSRWKYSDGSPAFTYSASYDPTPRVGGVRILILSGETVSITGLSLSVPDYALLNNIQLLSYSPDVFASGSITIIFGDSNQSEQAIWSMSAVMPANVSSSYRTDIIPMTSKPEVFTDPVSTASIVFISDTGSPLELDQMKFSSVSTTFPELKLSSRTISSSSSVPLISKIYGQPMDIEYYIRVT
jgi:hypothetical protein